MHVFVTGGTGQTGPAIVTELIGSGRIPVTSVSAEKASDHFGNPFMAHVFATDAPASSTHTRQLLGWSPNHRTLLDDLDQGDYVDAPTTSKANASTDTADHSDDARATS